MSCYEWSQEIVNMAPDVGEMKIDAELALVQGLLVKGL